MGKESARQADSLALGLYEMESIPFQDKIDQIPPEERSKYIVPIRASVGCNGFCSFCYRPFSSWHGLPAERVATLSDFYVSKGFRQILFSDENFIGTDLRRANVIADHFLKIKAEYPEFSFEFDARADSFGDHQADNFNHDLVKKFKEAGVSVVFTGIEGGNNADLDYYRKFQHGIDPLQQNVFYLTAMRQHGVHVEPGFIMLNEESTLQRVGDNIDFIHDYFSPELVPEMYWYRISYYSGSALTKRRIRELTKAGDREALRGITYGGLEVDFQDPEVQRFALVLDLVKAKFLEDENQINFELRDEPNLLARIGDQVRDTHTQHFKQYADIARTGDLARAPALVGSHYQTIRSLCITPNG
jgi:hypothetical protein